MLDMDIETLRGNYTISGLHGYFAFFAYRHKYFC